MARLESKIGFAIFGSLAIFLLSLFAIVHFTVASRLERRDRQALREVFHQAVEELEEGGVPNLAQMYSPSSPPDQQFYFVRLTSADGAVLYYHPPKGGEDFRVERLDSVRPRSDALQGEIWTELDHPSDGDSLEVLSQTVSGGRLLQLGKNTDSREDLLEEIQWLFLASAIPSLALALLGSFFFSRGIARPLREFIRTIEGLGRGDFRARVPMTRERGEVASLTRLFNEKLEKVESLVRGMRETVDNVAHDIRTPLTRLRGVAETALRSGSDPALYREALIQGVESSEHILAMVDTITEVSEAESGAMSLRRERITIGQLFELTTELYRFVADEKEIRLEAAVGSSESLWVDVAQMRRVLANLVDNAIKYTGRGGTVTLDSAIEGDRIVLSVTDTGIGIAETDLPRIWQRLFRTDQSRSQKGMGLGLTLVKAVVEAHAGSVRAESKPGQGTRISVLLPHSRDA